ncbi:LysR family transcriptional regulator [Seongchinamella sediminis]|uniref:LysR family transcriptional regulator n=1 Tax=Seongchinamella sediminis TaxID=2283635 RepID=UPI0013C2F6C6|nr:LysR family transcriptional regulator [Seongchinamella sediminis]
MAGGYCDNGNNGRSDGEFFHGCLLLLMPGYCTAADRWLVARGWNLIVSIWNLLGYCFAVLCPLLETVVIEQYLVFGTVAQEGSFTRAAETLGVSKSHISKQIAKLEASLRVRLFQRSPRKVQLTDVGQRLLADVEPMLAAYRHASETAHSFHSEPAGTVRLAISAVFAEQLLAPELGSFLQCHPKLSLELMLQQGAPSNLAENVDMAVTIGDLPDSSLVARSLGYLPARLVASPGYIKQHGAPVRPDDLTRHNCLFAHYPTLPFTREWTFYQSGEPAVVNVSGNLKLNDIQVMKALVLAGSGVAVLPRFLIHQELAAGTLQRLLPQWQMPNAPEVHLLYHHRRWRSPALQQVAAFLVETFRRHLSLQE